jgi:hypothetical protein
LRTEIRRTSSSRSVHTTTISMPKEFIPIVTHRDSSCAESSSIVRPGGHATRRPLPPAIGRAWRCSPRSSPGRPWSSRTQYMYTIHIFQVLTNLAALRGYASVSGPPPCNQVRPKPASSAASALLRKCPCAHPTIDRATVPTGNPFDVAGTQHLVNTSTRSSSGRVRVSRSRADIRRGRHFVTVSGSWNCSLSTGI